MALLKGHCSAEALPVSFLARRGAQVLGSVSLVYYCFTKAQTRSEWLTNVYVEAESRGLGIGSALVEHACIYAQTQGVASLKLYTQDKRSFYLQRGWKDAGSGIVQGADVAILSRVLSL